MKKLLFLTAIALVSIEAAFAQVEPRVAGDWKDAQGRCWHIGSDGRFQATANGQVVDSGKITANEGCLKIQSDSGRSEEGRFSVIGGQLQMHGGSLAGAWTKGPSSMTSSFSPPSKPVSSPALTVASSPDGSGDGGRQKTLSGSASVTGRPSQTQDYYASKYGSPSSSTSKPPASKPQEASAEQNKRAISDEQRIIEAVSKRNNHFSYDTANTSQRVNPQPNPNVVPKFGGKGGAKTYTDMFKTDHRTLPGFDPATADKPVMPNLGSPPNSVPAQATSAPKKYSATIGEYVKNKFNEASSSDKSYYNQLMSEQHSYGRPHAQGPQRVPQGGYIHVMKDKRARNYFQGK